MFTVNAPVRFGAPATPCRIGRHSGRLTQLRQCRSAIVEGGAVELGTIDVRSGPAWRSWLKKHHVASPGVWLVCHKDRSGVTSLPYEEAVRHALCFGWIDSLVKRLDDDRYARKFTPRKPASKWSDINRRRWADLEQQGLLAPAGVAAAPTANRYAPRPSIPALPGYVARALRTNAQAWKFFRALAPGYRRHFVVWIHTAKRPETRDRRIRESIALLAAGRKLGLK
jgi:uncharacterized protein YdeI (YjbR/CyaY-like superfamily)